MPDPTDPADDLEDDETEEKGPPSWRIDADAEHLEDEGRNCWTGYAPPIEDGDTLTLRVSSPAAENGEDSIVGPLSWLNSARVELDPKEDAVHFSASIFDPRGGFGFTIRRIPGGDNAGILVIHTPYQGAGFLHQDVRQLRPGTLEVVHDANLPRVPDTRDILIDLLKVPGVRGALARARGKNNILRARIEDWRKDEAKIAAATPIRVAIPEEE